jgi:hypothetical protein
MVGLIGKSSPGAGDGEGHLRVEEEGEVAAVRAAEAVEEGNGGGGEKELVGLA